MNDDLDDARALLPGVDLHPAGVLGGSKRSAVRRARAGWPDGRSGTVIVKTFVDPAGWVRESAALAVLPPDARAPQLLAAGASPPVVVMSDLGDGTSVADALLGADRSAAALAVDAWTDAIAAIHVATVGSRGAFRRELDARGGAEPLPLMVLSADLDPMIDRLREACEPVGVAVPEPLAGAFRAAVAQLDNDGGPAALSPSDACPDNNVFTDGGLALIDFEHAEWRHVAWDVAYLQVPWPSCWCSWRLPDDVAQRAVARYRDATAAHLPYVATPAFDRDLAVATALWSVLYSSWFLAAALVSDPPNSRGLRSPQRRALLLHRLGLARHIAAVPEIAAFAGELRSALVHRWGEVPLPLAPAFRSPADPSSGWR